MAVVKKYSKIDGFALKKRSQLHVMKNVHSYCFLEDERDSSNNLKRGEIIIDEYQHIFVEGR